MPGRSPRPSAFASAKLRGYTWYTTAWRHQGAATASGAGEWRSSAEIVTGFLSGMDGMSSGSMVEDSGCRISALDSALGHTLHDPALREQVRHDRRRHRHEVGGERHVVVVAELSLED